MFKSLLHSSAEVNRRRNQPSQNFDFSVRNKDIDAHGRGYDVAVLERCIHLRKLIFAFVDHFSRGGEPTMNATD